MVETMEMEKLISYYIAYTRENGSYQIKERNKIA